MRINPMPIYQKGSKRKRSNKPTAEQLELHAKLRALGCGVKNDECEGYTEIHHCFTKMGQQKDHDKVAPLCTMHHRGKWGIDGKVIGKRAWQKRYCTEQELIDKTHALIK